ncbi:MAG: hypothetical protein B7Z55_09170, partial [Planctomycetales bacterium 12-60-4]
QTAGWADESHCVDCHVQGTEFWQTGHAHALRSARAEESIALLTRFESERPVAAKDLHLILRPDELRVIDSQRETPRSIPLDWCFGSGRHASTWVGTLTDSWGGTDPVEFRWTWYAQQQEFDITPGQPSVHGDGYFGKLGVLFDQPKARRCFACHATQLPVESGHIDESGIHPGVTCQRCHGPQANHVASDGAILPESLHHLDREESISRCAQCHRRADELAEKEISPKNVDIVRFQPVGLVQSACYRQSPKLTCITCHDPHRPMEAQDSAGIWQCTQCHNPEQPSHQLCGAGHRDDCLTCHMPKVRGGPPVSFTDHWIRIRAADKATR